MIENKDGILSAFLKKMNLIDNSNIVSGLRTIEAINELIKRDKESKEEDILKMITEKTR